MLSEDELFSKQTPIADSSNAETQVVELPKKSMLVAKETSIEDSSIAESNGIKTQGLESCTESLFDEENSITMSLVLETQAVELPLELNDVQKETIAEELSVANCFFLQSASKFVPGQCVL